MSLTLHFMPYSEIEFLTSSNRIRKIIGLVKENKIVLLQGRLRDQEEAELIKNTMESINQSFKGIELAVIDPQLKNADILNKIRANVINAILGDRQGLTIIGPAAVVKEIKKDPNKIELLTNDAANKKKKKKK